MPKEAGGWPPKMAFAGMYEIRRSAEEIFTRKIKEGMEVAKFGHRFEREKFRKREVGDGLT